MNASQKHILVVSDEPRFLAETKMALKNCFDVGIASSSEAAISSLETYDTSMVVICITENRDNAFSIFTDIFDFVKHKNIPVIFLAEKGSTDDETAAFAMGAVDYSARRQGTSLALINRIRLRIQAGENEKYLQGREKPQAPAPPTSVLVGKTILIVEDVAINREIVAALLSDIEDLVLEFAEDGKEAVEKFTQNPSVYSLILMDVQMPVMDGLEATRAIRELGCKNAGEIPIIALTAGVQEGEITKCLQAGMHDFIEKPMDYNNLLAVIAKYCL
jgi:CheY-like chemotaxis protein